MSLLALGYKTVLARRSWRGQQMSGRQIGVTLGVAVVGMWIAAVGAVMEADSTFTWVFASGIVVADAVVTYVIVRLWLPELRRAFGVDAHN